MFFHWFFLSCHGLSRQMASQVGGLLKVFLIGQIDTLLGVGAIDKVLPPDGLAGFLQAIHQLDLVAVAPAIVVRLFSFQSDRFGLWPAQ